MHTELDAPLIDDPRRYMREVSKEWDTFMKIGTVPDDRLRRTIIHSWKRCRERGIDPLSFRAPTLGPEAAVVDPDLVAIARGVVQELDSNLQQTRHLIAICDANGRIFEVGGDAEVILHAVNVNIDCGGVWAESLVGTNGIGTSLQEQRPVQVFATEHFCAGWQDWTCSAAPIRAPSGAVIGGVNISSHCAPVHPHTLEFTAAVARQLEADLSNRYLARRIRLLEAFCRYQSDYPMAALLAVDRTGQVVAASPMLSSMVAEQLLAQYALRWMAAAGHAGEECRGLELEHTLPDGRKVWTEWHHVHGDREVVGAVGIVGIAAPTRPVQEPQEWRAWEGAVPKSPAIKATLATAQKLAATDLPALILGETGTGKELVARAIHRGSRRASGPFIGVNCGALAQDLIISELFGYEAGAFTGASRTGCPGKFEQAHGGTLLLDEVCDLSPQAQAALLRVLETGEVMRVGSTRVRRVDVRVLAATNRDLGAEVRAGQFREDLHFRLNSVELVVPPLRERQADIPVLVSYFLARSNNPHVTVGAEAMAALKRYHWPGNVRELRNVILRAAMVQEGGLILPDHLLLRSAAPPKAQAGGWTETKRSAVLAAVSEVRGNVAAAARRLGVSRWTVYRYMHQGTDSHR